MSTKLKMRFEDLLDDFSLKCAWAEHVNSNGPDKETLRVAIQDREDARAALMYYVYSEEDIVKDLFMKVQQQRRRMVTPLFPKVLVRVIGKEQVVGGIILPESGTGGATSNQNKPVWEGIVLDTYPPFVKEVKITGEWVEQKFEPRVKPGDHVLFAHWVGVTTLVSLGDSMRFIDENEIQGVIEYEQIPGEPIMAKTTSGGERR